MTARSLTLIALGVAFAWYADPTAAQDASLCFAAADRVKEGTLLTEDEKLKAHQACLDALAASGNVVQKYHLQEADFDVMGTRPKQ